MSGLVPSGIGMIINRRKWFSATSPCFKVLGNVLAIELDRLSMRYIDQFVLGRLLGMVHKFMYGDASHEWHRISETDTR